MAPIAVADRMRVARLVMGLGAASVRAALVRPWRILADWTAPAPERLLIAPQDIRTADPTIATDIYSGYFALGRRIVDTHGRSPFEITNAPPEWEAALCGFGWLRHLRGADTALARTNARALVADWISSSGQPGDQLAWRIDVAARRLISWLSQSPLILEGADRSFYRRFMKSLGRHAVYLRAAIADAADGEARLLAIIALAFMALCASNMAKLQKRSTRLLTSELTRAILPDGGHISRNPQRLMDLLADLLPLRQAYAARSLDVPAQLLNSIDRMMPMLRLFRHGDGSLALFNGMSVTAPDVLATVLAYDDARARPLGNAPYSAYQRAEAEGILVIVDAGKPPPPGFSTRAHAGTLSFELSSGAQRIIVNCGAPAGASGPMREAARATAAHSTLVVADVSSCRFAAQSALDRWLDGQILAGPAQVECQRSDGAGATVIEATHDGYERRFGLIHARRIELSGDGRSLSGEDRLRTSGRRVPGANLAEYAIRFHLHPSVQAELADEGRAVLLTLGDASRWLFYAGGMRVDVEESIFFALPDGPRASRQIAVYANLREAAEVAWSFERLEA